MRGRGQRILRACFLVLLGAYLALAAFQLLAQIGLFPRYGDTKEYLVLATTLKVDGYRGILYPAFLAGIDKLVGHSLLAGYEHNTLHLGLPAPPPSAIWIQITQLFLFGVALVYALQAALPSTRRRRPFQVLWAILFLDPVLLHLNLSILSDGLCLSCLLLFAGGLASLVRRRGRPWFHWCMIFVGGLGSSLLRVEKIYVIVLVLILFIALALWLRRKSSTVLTRRSALGLGAVALLLALSTQWIESATTISNWRWPTTVRWPREISWLHERIIRPNMHAIRDELPSDLQERLTPSQIEQYDSSVQGARSVMYHLCRTGSPRLEDVTHEMAGAVLHDHPLLLAKNVLHDALGHLFITPSFYLDLARSGTDPTRFDHAERENGNLWTYLRIAGKHPQRAKLLLLLAGVAGMVATVLTLTRGVVAWRSGARPDAKFLLALTPFLLLWIVNAMAFTAAGQVIHIRYGLIAHATALGMVWYPALASLL
ncbi:MAG TPA: hypothetical protein VKA63_07570 [Candidatus Krumholzibacteria bacterium]|nr:hypothetical protein [Candidatus Krumholzibacteria bacterium]